MAAPAAPKLGMKEIREQRRRESELRQAAARERKKREARITELEAAIEKLEDQQRTLTERLENPQMYQNTSKALELNRELAGVADSLAKANAEWSRLVEENSAESEA